MTHLPHKEAGFTLVEMIVAIALFAVVMLVAVGALLSLTGANRKAQALQSVMNNLDIALDDIVRNVRMGSNYYCGTDFSGATHDCTDGGSSFSFTPYCDPSASCDRRWIYSYNSATKEIYKDVINSSGGDEGALAITAPEVAIESLTFYVVGSTPGDAVQPKVLIVVKGEAGNGLSQADTTFHIEATAVQRELDLN